MKLPEKHFEKSCETLLYANLNLAGRNPGMEKQDAKKVNLTFASIIFRVCACAFSANQEFSHHHTHFPLKNPRRDSQSLEKCCSCCEG